jgi:hypothetical protein
MEYVEDALRTQMRVVVEDAPRGKDTAELDSQIARLQTSLDAREGDLLSLVQFAADERTPASRAAVRQKEREVEDLRGRLRDLRAQRDTLTTASVAKRLSALELALTQEPFDVSTANCALRQAFKKIVVRPRDAALVLHWHHTEETAHVPFHSRHMDWAVGVREY